MTVSVSIRIFAVSVFVVSLFIAAVPAFAKAPQAPDFELTSLDGQTMGLKEYRGRKPVLLVFWTTWCPYCKEELQQIDDFLARYDGTLAVLGINSGWRDSVSRAKQFRERYKIDIPLAFDKDHEVSERYGIRGVPTIFVVDKEGKVVFSGHRFSEDLTEVLDDVTT